MYYNSTIVTQVFSRSLAPHPELEFVNILPRVKDGKLDFINLSSNYVQT